jgi:hypothetical protein
MDRTAKQKAASRTNGAAGGRPSKDLVRRLTGIRDRARSKGVSALKAAVEYMIHVLHDSSQDPSLRMRAAENISDRFGLPRMQSIHQVDETAAAPKLYIEPDFSDPKFKAPASFNPLPPGDPGTDACDDTSSQELH